VARRKIGRAYRVDDAEAVRAAFERTREGLDFVAKHAGPTGHLVGERFSVADLTAASLLAPTTHPPDCAMTRPEPMPACVEQWLDRFSDHPGVAWVLRTYREERPSA
jgi:glutathione S-transferase